MRYPVLCRKLMPCQGRAFIDRKNDPAGMVLTGFDPPVINPEISPELQCSLYYIAAVPYILKNAELDPEIRLQFPGFPHKLFLRKLLAFAFVNINLAFVHQVKGLYKRELHFSVIKQSAVPALVIKLLRLV